MTPLKREVYDSLTGIIFKDITKDDLAERIIKIINEKKMERQNELKEIENKLNFGIVPGETWRHYKGGTYKIITLANHSETKEPLVIYQSISFGSIYARPLAMWEDTIENKRGGIEPRFTKLS